MALTLTEVPEGAAELVLLLEDPDAPGGIHVHWVLLGIEPACGGLEEGKVSAGAVGDLGERERPVRGTPATSVVSVRAPGRR
jgi:phosphatidylethanolamine-binding protein (PEBP) family uncharacterized protein